MGEHGPVKFPSKPLCVSLNMARMNEDDIAPAKNDVPLNVYGGLGLLGHRSEKRRQGLVRAFVTLYRRKSRLQINRKNQNRVQFRAEVNIDQDSCSCNALPDSIVSALSDSEVKTGCAACGRR